MSLPHPPSRILALFLIAEEVFDNYDSDGWPLFQTKMPEKGLNDDCAAIYDTAGTLDGTLQVTKEQVHHYGIQVKVRSRDYADGWEKANEVLDALRDILRESLTIGAVTYLIQAVNPTSDVIPLGQEIEGTKRRELFTVNALATISVQA